MTGSSNSDAQPSVSQLLERLQAVFDHARTVPLSDIPPIRADRAAELVDDVREGRSRR